MQDYFADMIGNVSITGSVVRIEFLRLSSADAEKKQLKFEPSQRMVMPIEGFLRSLDMLDKLKQKLLEDGLIKQTEQPASS